MWTEFAAGLNMAGRLPKKSWPSDPKSAICGQGQGSSGPKIRYPRTSMRPFLGPKIRYFPDKDMGELQGAYGLTVPVYGGRHRAVGALSKFGPYTATV